MTAKTEIIQLLKKHYPKELHKGQIFIELDSGYLPDNISRKCRELASDKIIERIRIGKSVSYRYIPQDFTEETKKVFAEVKNEIRQKTLL